VVNSRYGYTRVLTQILHRRHFRLGFEAGHKSACDPSDKLSVINKCYEISLNVVITPLGK